MSRVNGYLEQLSSAAANDVVTCRMASFPQIRGQSLVVPDQRVYRARPGDGYWEFYLGVGVYEISVVAPNGQRAWVLINQTHNDDETYSFEELVTSDLPQPEAPVGGDQPTASANVLGIVRVDEDHAQPVASTGFIQRANLAALRLVDYKTFLKRAWLTSPEAGAAREWYFDAASTAVDDGTNTTTAAKPHDRTSLEAGRWLIW